MIVQNANVNKCQLSQTCRLKLPYKIQSSRNLRLLTVNDLTDEEEHNENEIDEESLGVEKPHLACFVAQHEKRSDTSDEQQEDGQ